MGIKCNTSVIQSTIKHTKMFGLIPNISMGLEVFYVSHFVVQQRCSEISL